MQNNMRCQKCGLENSPESHVCQSCHTPLYETTPNVAVPNNPPSVDASQFLNPEMPQTSGGIKKILAIVAGVLIFAGVALGGYWGYSKYIANTPDKVLKKSVQATNQIKASSFKLDLKLEFQEKQAAEQATSTPTLNLIGGLLGTEKQKMYAEIEGYTDNTDENNLRSKFKIDIGLDIGGTTNNIAGEVVTLGKNLYFKINQLPIMLAMFIDTSSIKDKWVKYSINTTVLDKFAGQEDEDTKKIGEILEQDADKIIILKNDYGVETLGENKTYHYQLGLDKQGILDMIEKIKTVSKNKAEIEKNMAEMKEEDWQNFDRFVKNFSLDIWIDKKEYFIRKIEIPFDNIGKDKDGNQTLGGAMTITFDNFNQIMEIESPKDPVELEKLLSEAFGGGMFGALDKAQTKNSDAKTVSEIKQIQTALELYFVDNNGYPKNEIPAATGVGNMKVLCSKGFRASIEECAGSTVYMSEVPGGDKIIDGGYLYTSIKPNDYTLVFQLLGDSGNLKAGENVATPNGISSMNNGEDYGMGLEMGTDLDTDNDGITDEEEIFIWETDPSKADTDGDGYKDGDEVEHGYDPLIPGSAKLK
ncbi:hypothetical protein GYA54_00800 [Candidatus Kuenenbacteria bacterium]|nr:hypothetical protein [Candidatus Kuenenbacteria bacterium]